MRNIIFNIDNDKVEYYYIKNYESYLENVHNSSIKIPSNEFSYLGLLTLLSKKSSMLPSLTVSDCSDGKLSISLGDNNEMDVHISLQKNDKILLLKDQNMYIVSDSDGKTKNIIVKDDIKKVLCCIDMVKCIGEVLYPEHKKSVKFKFFKKQLPGMFKEEYFMVQSTDDDLPDKYKRNVLIPLCITESGIYLPDHMEELKMKEIFAIDSKTNKFTLSRSIILIN